MNVFGHDHVTPQTEVTTVASFREDFQKGVACAWRSEERSATITTTGDEVEMVETVAAFESILHLDTEMNAFSDETRKDEPEAARCQ